MTKKERLKELKIQDTFYKELDKIFNAGWREFVKGIFHANDISNFRVFKILYDIKGSQFCSDLEEFMKSCKSKHSRLSFTKNPKGVVIKDSRWVTITEYLVDKHPSGSYNEMTFYIQIKENGWVKFTA